MPTDYSAPERATIHLDREILMEPEPPVSISHFTHVIRRYGAVILLSLAGILLAYLIIAVGLYLFSPGERVTSQPFRLDFEGAGRGEYPNKTKFNIADVISGPILTRVWQDNHLAEYVPFGAFSRSVFILEFNREFEALAADYQAKLGDAKLSPIDRDRLQREFELKTQSIAKNEYAIYFNRAVGDRSIPEPLARKVLLDILNDWADFAVNRQHVMLYEVSVLSPEILKPSALERSDGVAAIEVLRAKTNRVISNIRTIERLPGATMARTPSDRLSMEEIRIRLDEILRFRLEPLLVTALHSPALVADRAGTIRFLESQLAYDQRQLDSAQRLADSIRDSIAVYEQPVETTQSPTAAGKSPEPSKAGEAIMPQLSDTFLDRLMSMTGRAADALYRQTLVDDYRKAVIDTIPLKQAVAFDTQVLEELRKPSGGTASMSAASVQAQITATRTEVGDLINKMNDLFQAVSRNMTPSTQLLTLTGPPTTRTLRSLSLQRLALYGLLVLLVSIPTVIVFCLVHNRVREEEAAEEHRRHEHATGP